MARGEAYSELDPLERNLALGLIPSLIMGYIITRVLCTYMAANNSPKDKISLSIWVSSDLEA